MDNTKISDAFDKKNNIRFYAPRGREMMPIIEKRDNVFAMDTMFYNLRGHKRAIFCSIEVTSRFAFARLYKHINPTGEETVEILEELKKTHKVEHLCCDPGIEYNNGDVVNWCNENNVSLYFYGVGEKTEKSIIERFNRTLRELLNMYVSHAGWNWADELENIVDFYNHRKHRGIGKAPIDITQEDRMNIRYKAEEKSKKYIDKMNSFEPGSRVIVWVGADPAKSTLDLAKETFNKKTGKRWTDKVYTVEGVSGYKIKLVGYDRRVSPRDLYKVPDSFNDYVKADDPEESDALKLRRLIRNVLREKLYEKAKELKENKHEEPSDKPVLRERPPKPEVNTTRRRKREPKPPIEDKEEPETYEVAEITGHKIINKKLYLNTVYSGYEDEDPTLQPIENFMFENGMNVVAEKYIKDKKLQKYLK